MRSHSAFASPAMVPVVQRVRATHLALILALACAPACTMNPVHPARTLAEATGGESMERVFWNHLQAANWTLVERALASNYVGTEASTTLDRAAALAQYRQWQLKSYSLGDLKTELNGSTVVVTYSIALTGTAASQPLPAAPQRMLTVWQQQKAGWIQIAHTVSTMPSGPAAP